MQHAHNADAVQGLDKEMIPGDWDYIVVGGGTAGCVVANRLSGNGKRVLVLEAGGRDWSPYIWVPAGRLRLGMRYDWNYPVEPDLSRNGKSDYWASGKVVGGSSSINGMLWVRGSPAEYDDWEKRGCMGWDYEGILPYFKRLERFDGGSNAYRGAHGPQYISFLRIHHPLTKIFRDTAVKCGYPFNEDYNSESPNGVGYAQVTQRRGLRHNAARAYLTQALRRKTVALETQALVRRIVFSGRQAVGVEYSRKNGRVELVRSRRGVILCAGSIGSPKLLLLSGIGPKDELQILGIDPVNDLPGVGKELRDHVYMPMVYEVDLRTLNRELSLGRVVKEGWNLALRGRGIATSAFGHALLFSAVNDNRGKFEAVFAPFGLTAKEGDVDSQHKLRMMRVNAVTIRIGLMQPAACGEIVLASRDPTVPPVIRFECMSDARDLENLIAACRRMRTLMRTEPMGGHIIQEMQPGTAIESDMEWEQAIRRTCTRGNHAAGTCRMGVDQMAVVDPQLRVKGIDGLWVIDLSIAPVLPSGNTHAAAMMIAERGAELVASVSRNGDD